MEPTHHSDMTSYIGFWCWLGGDDVLVRRWNKHTCTLDPLSDEEQVAYSKGCKNMEFDFGQTLYPPEMEVEWRNLTCYITKEVIIAAHHVTHMYNSLTHLLFDVHHVADSSLGTYQQADS